MFIMRNIYIDDQDLFQIVEKDTYVRMYLFMVLLTLKLTGKSYSLLIFRFALCSRC